MICPQCKEEIKHVNVYSECVQKGNLEGNKVVDYDLIDEITETVAIECPECSYNFYQNGGLDY
jgi:DNA-directed RNA polymerase subunit RPC12/RpoP